jgi:hypothetical protein
MIDITLLLKVVGLAIGLVFGGGFLIVIWPSPWVELAAFIRHGRKYGFIRINVTSSDDGSEESEGGSRTGFADPVLGQQNHTEPEPVLKIEQVIAFLTEHNLTDEQATIMFAVMRREDGEHFLSANKIRDVVGGADAVVKAQVAAYRPRQSRPKPAARLERPANGW